MPASSGLGSTRFVFHFIFSLRYSLRGSRTAGTTRKPGSHDFGVSPADRAGAADQHHTDFTQLETFVAFPIHGETSVRGGGALCDRRETAARLAMYPDSARRGTQVQRDALRSRTSCSCGQVAGSRGSVLWQYTQPPTPTPVDSRQFFFSSFLFLGVACCGGYGEIRLADLSASARGMEGNLPDRRSVRRSRPADELGSQCSLQRRAATTRRSARHAPATPLRRSLPGTGASMRLRMRPSLELPERDGYRGNSQELIPGRREMKPFCFETLAQAAMRPRHQFAALDASVVSAAAPARVSRLRAAQRGGVFGWGRGYLGIAGALQPPSGNFHFLVYFSFVTSFLCSALHTYRTERWAPLHFSLSPVIKGGDTRRHGLFLFLSLFPCFLRACGLERWIFLLLAQKKWQHFFLGWEFFLCSFGYHSFSIEHGVFGSWGFL